MPPSHLSESRARLSPERATANKDVGELQACLDKGWDPTGSLGEDGRPTYPLVERVIHRGWIEGWRALRTRWPNLPLEISLVKLAFRRLQGPILRDMFDQGAWAIGRPLIDGKTAMVLSLEALGAPCEVPTGDEHNAVPFDMRAVDVFTMLVKMGDDPYAPTDGDFHPDGVELAGHSAWTRAMFNMRWPLALALMPTLLSDVTRQKRLPLALSQLVEESSNRYQSTRQMAQQVYALWIERFGEWWFAQPEVMAPQTPQEWGFILQLSPIARSHVWAAWGMAHDHAVNTFHTLALESKSKDILPVLHRLLDDIGEPAAWMHPSVEDIRPCDLWALALDGEIPAQPWTLAQALEQTRQRGDGLLRRPT